MSLDRKFIDENIKLMNTYRAKHQAAALRHNSDLSSIAQRWAEQLVRSNTLSHSQSTYKGEPLGENCAMRWSSDGRVVTVANDIIDSWYSEVKDYNFRSGPSGGKKTGHFTQAVWKGSREVGVGKAISRDGKTCMVVANFYPAGNYSNQYVENVKPPADGKIVLPAKQSPVLSDSRVTRTAGPPIRAESSSYGSFFSSSLLPHRTSRQPVTPERKPSPVLSSRYTEPQSRIQMSTGSWDQPSLFGGRASSVNKSTSGSTVLRREARRETVGSGPNAVVKTITTETVVGPDGRTKTVTTETVESRGAAGSRADEITFRIDQGSGRKW